MNPHLLENGSANFPLLYEKVANPMSTADTAKNVAYVIVGALGSAINILTFAILFKNKALFRKSAVLVGIAVANFSVSLHIVSTGAFRMASAKLTHSIEAYDCVLTVLPLLYPLSFVSEGVLVPIAGLECVLAINAPLWFHETWTDKASWRIVGASYALVALVVVVGVGLSFTSPPTTWTCGADSVFGKIYLSVCQAVSASGGAAGATLAILALMTGLRQFRKLPLLSGHAARLRKRLQLAKSLSLIALADFGLVGVPNLLSLLKMAMPDISFPTFIRGSNANYTFCANAAVVFLALMAFNYEFRRAAAKIFCTQNSIPVVNARLAAKENRVQPIAS